MAVAAVVLGTAVIASTAVPEWQNPWIASALAAAVVGWAVDHRPPGPLGVLAAAGPVAALAWSVYLLGAGSPGGAAGGVPLAAAGVLGALVLLARDVDHPARPGLVAFVLGSAVAALGFGLGRGTGPDAVAAATAVLVAGSPAALLLVPPRTRRVDAVVVPAQLLTTGELQVRAIHLLDHADEGDVRRFAAALHRAALDRATPDRATPDRATLPCAALPCAPAPSDTGSGALGRAVVAATSRELPGVSDLDGRPDTGLRGVVSELREDRVVAHAVLVGPPQWLAEHGVDAPAGAGPGSQAVAWDGVARGWLEITEEARPGATAAIAGLRRRGVEVIPGVAPTPDGSTAAVPPSPGRVMAVPPSRDLPEVVRAVRRQHHRVHRRRVCLVVARAAAVGGAAAALVGLLNPATAVTVPVAASVLLVAGTLRRHHPFGATA